jgi:hypothetical protein
MRKRIVHSNLKLMIKDKDFKICNNSLKDYILNLILRIDNMKKEKRENYIKK